MGGGGSMISEYNFGRIVVNGKEYNSDLIILPDRIIDDWWRQQGHRLSVDDLREVMAADIDILVVGTGKLGAMKVPRETIEALAAENVEVRIAPTDQACEIFEQVCRQQPTAAALHLTC